jgi:hypothetical protein
MNVNTRNFNIFAFSDLMGREKTLPLLSIHFFMQNDLMKLVNERKFSNFLVKVTSTYQKEVQYHNDLHGIDVAHMANLILNDGGLK